MTNKSVITIASKRALTPVAVLLAAYCVTAFLVNSPQPFSSAVGAALGAGNTMVAAFLAGRADRYSFNLATSIVFVSFFARLALLALLLYFLSAAGLDLMSLLINFGVATGVALAVESLALLTVKE